MKNLLLTMNRLSLTPRFSGVWRGPRPDTNRFNGLFVIVVLLLLSPSAFAADYKNINVDQFEKLRAAKTNIVLDVRTKKEYNAGHIPGAVLIDFNSPDFDKKIAALDKDKTYLVHCAVGGRSAKASAKLVALDFKNVYHLPGGYRAWEKAGHKPEK